jgi:O-antigen/teichoic acid export membrane protein
MINSRSSNGMRNIGAGVLNRGILILLPFIIRTIVVYTLGSSYLGLSSLFLSILMVLNLSELGFGSALVYSMYKPVAIDDKLKIRALLKLYRKIYQLIGIAILLVGLVLTPFLTSLIKGQWPSDINIHILYLIYLFNTAISYFVFAHKRALLTAYQRSDVISNINTIISISIYLLQIVILLATQNYYLYVCIFPLFTIIENLWISFATNRRFPDLICEGSLPRTDKLAIKEHVKGIALQKIASTSRHAFSSIIISMYLGLTMIAIYSNYYFIMISIHMFLYQIPNAIRAIVGNSIASESLDKNYKDFNSMYLIYMWISGWCAVCLMVLYQPFMLLWMGNEMMLPLETTILFCIYFVLLSMSDIVALYKDGAGLWWFGRYRVAIEAILNLILSFIFGWLWGINGILISTILTITFIGHGYGGYIVFHYYFKTKQYGTFILKQLGYLLIIAIVAALTYYVCSLLPMTGILALIIKAFICLIFTNILFGLILRKHVHYEQAKLFALNIFHTFGKKMNTI